jgi:ArsR family transcriptional regulator
MSASLSILKNSIKRSLRRPDLHSIRKYPDFDFQKKNITRVDISAYADILVCMKTTALIFKALGDETRLRIMALLLDGQELCVCDIMAALDLPQSTVSRHLSYLRNAGLVDDRRQGVWMNYTINKENTGPASALSDLLSSLLSDQDQSVLDKRLLKKHLATKKKNICS